MIRLPATSFGYGLRVGLTHIMGDHEQFDLPVGKQGYALTFPFLPSLDAFNRVAKIPVVEFCIFPPCTPYSHLGAATWFNNMPTMAIQQPWNLVNGVWVLADFDHEILLVAESESEAEELRRQVREILFIRSTSTSNSMTPHRIQDTITVLAEVNAASDVIQALADGADGLGVVNAERLFHHNAGNSSDVEALIHNVKANPQVLPLPVRFFDPDQESWDIDRRLHIPQRSLGYRGVRILEVNDTWFQRFIAGLETLELEQIIVVLPMVTLLSEVQRFRERLGLRWERLGITVETPAAALRIKELLEVADYIQIGLNDLTQYTMAWDRDVPNQERLPADRIVAPVADLITAMAAACAAARVPYTLGMDLRPSASLVAQVLGLGVKSVSCAPSLVKPWKNAIHSHLSSHV